MSQTVEWPALLYINVSQQQRAVNLTVQKQCFESHLNILPQSEYYSSTNHVISTVCDSFHKFRGSLHPGL